jgi:putative flippase GtrA
MRETIRGASGSAAGRFLALGGANTLVTGATFYALSGVLDPALAFTLVYVAGLVFVTYATPRFVFGTRPPARRRSALGAWYMGVYLVGLGVTRLLDRGLDLDRVPVVVGTISVTAGLGFIGARLLVGSPEVERP